MAKMVLLTAASGWASVAGLTSPIYEIVDPLESRSRPSLVSRGPSRETHVRHIQITVNRCRSTHSLSGGKEEFYNLSHSTYIRY